MTAILAQAVEHAQYQLKRCPPCDEGDLTRPCDHPMGDPRAVIAELLPEVQKLAEVQRLVDEWATSLSAPTSVAAQVLDRISALFDQEPS